MIGISKCKGTCTCIFYNRLCCQYITGSKLFTGYRSWFCVFYRPTHCKNNRLPQIRGFVNNVIVIKIVRMILLLCSYRNQNIEINSDNIAIQYTVRLYTLGLHNKPMYKLDMFFEAVSYSGRPTYDALHFRSRLLYEARITPKAVSYWFTAKLIDILIISRYKI